MQISNKVLSKKSSGQLVSKLKHRRSSALKTQNQTSRFEPSYNANPIISECSSLTCSEPCATAYDDDSNVNYAEIDSILNLQGNQPRKAAPLLFGKRQECKVVSVFCDNEWLMFVLNQFSVIQPILTATITYQHNGEKRFFPLRCFFLHNAVSSI